MTNSPRPCVVCGSMSFKVVYPSTVSSSVVANQSFYTPTYNKALLHGEISKCSECSLLFVSDQPDRGTYRDVYASMEDPDYLLEEEGYAASFNHVLREIQPFTGEHRRLLEVGCGAGLFLKSAQKEGWKINGIELSKWMVAQAEKSLGVGVVRQGGYESDLYQDQKFDVVVALHLIEHVPDPADFLLKMQNHLDDDAILYLVTPDIGSLIARILKEKWWYIQIPHIYYFDRKTISQLLHKTGYDIIEVKNFPRFINRTITRKRIDFFPPLIKTLLNLVLWPLLCFDWSLKFDTRDQLAVIAKRKKM